MSSHWDSVLRMNKGAMQLTLMEIFSKVTKRRILEDSDKNKPVNPLVVN